MSREIKSTFKALKEITIDNFPKIIQDLLIEFYLDDKAIFTAITDTRVTPAETYKFPKDVIFGDSKLYEKLYNAEKNFINKNQMVLDVVNIVVTALQKNITTVNNTIKTLQKTLDGNPARAGILVIGSVSKFIREEEAKENNKEPVTKEYDTFKQLLECSKTLISDIYSNYEAIKGQMMPLLCVRIFIEYMVLLNDDESKEKEIIVNIENEEVKEINSDDNTNPEQEIISEYVEEEPKEKEIIVNIENEGVKEMDSDDNQEIVSEYVEEEPNVQNSIKRLAKNLSTLSPGIGESNMEEQVVNMYNGISSIIQEFSKNKIPETPEQQKIDELFKVDKLPELFDNFIINIGEKISFKSFDFNTFHGNSIYKMLCYVNNRIDKINENIFIIPKTILRIINKIHTKDVYTRVKSFINTFKISDIEDMNESLITICKNLYAVAIVYKILNSHGYKFPNKLDEFINQSTDFYSIYEFGCSIKNKLSKYAEMLVLCLFDNNTNDSDLIMLQNEYDAVCKFAYDTYITKNNLVYQDEENREIQEISNEEINKIDNEIISLDKNSCEAITHLITGIGENYKFIVDIAKLFQEPKKNSIKIVDSISEIISDDTGKLKKVLDVIQHKNVVNHFNSKMKFMANYFSKLILYSYAMEFDKDNVEEIYTKSLENLYKDTPNRFKIIVSNIKCMLEYYSEYPDKYIEQPVTKLFLANRYTTAQMVCLEAIKFITTQNNSNLYEKNNENDKPEVSDKKTSNVIQFNKYIESPNPWDIAEKISKKIIQNKPDNKKINVETPKEKDNESEKFDISKIFDLKKFIIKKLSEYGVTSEVINKEIKGDKNFTSLKDIIEKIDIVYKDKNINEMENRYSIEHFLDIIYSEEKYNSTMSNYKNIFKLSEEDALFTLLTSILCSLENK